MIKECLTQEETKLIFCQKLVVMIILMATAIGFSYTIYHIMHKAELRIFHEELEAAAEIIIEAMNGTYIHIGSTSWTDSILIIMDLTTVEI